MSTSSEPSLCVMLFFFGLWVFGVCSGSIVKATTCIYENVTYTARETFKPDHCTFCRCPRWGGEVTCSITDCKWEPHCRLRDVSDPSACCPRCLEFGCIHSDGKVYPKGAQVSKSVCSTCYCPESGGRTLCAVKRCPHVRCVDHVTRDGSCCPVCPNGSNCQYNGTLIPVGQLMEMGNQRCRCHRLKLSSGTTLFASCRKKIYWTERTNSSHA